MPRLHSSYIASGPTAALHCTQPAAARVPRRTAPPAQVLSGHEGPVAGLAFSPTSSLLASASWDHTLRTWDVFAGKGQQSHDTRSCLLQVRICSMYREGQHYTEVGLLQVASRCCHTRTMCWRSPSGQTAGSWPAPRWTASCTCGTRWRASCRCCCRCSAFLCSCCCCCVCRLLVGCSVQALVACPGTGLG